MPSARKLNRRAVVLASSALTHALVRGREHWPTDERVDADKIVIDKLKRGDIESVIDGFAQYSSNAVVEMGGRAIATMLGSTRALASEKGQLAASQFGGYAQSNVHLAATSALKLQGIQSAGTGGRAAPSSRFATARARPGDTAAWPSRKLASRASTMPRASRSGSGSPNEVMVATGGRRA